MNYTTFGKLIENYDLYCKTIFFKWKFLAVKIILIVKPCKWSESAYTICTNKSNIFGSCIHRRDAFCLCNIFCPIYWLWNCTVAHYFLIQIVIFSSLHFYKKSCTKRIRRKLIKKYMKIKVLPHLIETDFKKNNLSEI